MNRINQSGLNDIDILDADLFRFALLLSELKVERGSPQGSRVEKAVQNDQTLSPDGVYKSKFLKLKDSASKELFKYRVFKKYIHYFSEEYLEAFLEPGAPYRSALLKVLKHKLLFQFISKAAPFDKVNIIDLIVRYIIDHNISDDISKLTRFQIAFKIPFLKNNIKRINSSLLFKKVILNSKCYNSEEFSGYMDILMLVFEKSSSAKTFIMTYAKDLIFRRKLYGDEGYKVLPDKNFYIGLYKYINKGKTRLNIEKFINQPNQHKWTLLSYPNPVTPDIWSDHKEKLKSIAEEVLGQGSNYVSSFFRKLMLTQDAINSHKTESKIRKEAVALVLFLEKLLTSSKEQNNAEMTLKKILSMIREGGEHCPDRVSVMFSKALLEANLYNNETFKLDILTQQFKLKAIESVAIDPNNAENVESFFYYTLMLNHVFNLGINSEKMLYEGVAQKKSLEHIALLLITQTFSHEDLTSFIASSDYVKSMLKKQFAEIYSLTQQYYKLIYLLEKPDSDDEAQLQKWYNELDTKVPDEAKSYLIDFFEHTSFEELKLSLLDNKLTLEDHTWAEFLLNKKEIKFRKLTEKTARELLINAGYIIEN